METGTLEKIRQANLRAVFKVIAKNDSVSRSEIAEKTELSLMTVGKTVDLLLMHGAVKQSKTAQNRAGRRAGLLTANRDRCLVTLTLSSSKPTLSVFDLCLNLICEESLPFEKGFDAVCLRELLIKTRQRFGSENIYAIGISLPSAPCPHPLLSSAEEQIKSIFPEIPYLSDSHGNSAAFALADRVADCEEKNILCWMIGNGTAEGAYVVNGELFFGMNGSFARLGSMHGANGEPLSSRTSRACSAVDYAEMFSTDAANILHILCPHTLILSVDPLYYGIGQKLPQKLVESFGFTNDSLPEIIELPYSAEDCQIGLAMRLQNLWLNSLS